MNRFILMLQFLTRLPINKQVPCNMEDFRYGSKYFPVVGLVLGILGVVAYVPAFYAGNKLFAAVLVVLVETAVTGALHLDGLADTCDGLFSSRSKEKMLEIMKDSRIGTMGALALIFSVLIKVSVIWGMSFTAGLYSIIAAPVISRTSVLYGITIAKYPRENGLGKTFIGNVTNREFIIGLILCLLIISPILKFYALIFLPFIFIGPQLINRYVESKIGGMTGDTLGALYEIQEMLSLIILFILSNNIWK